MATDGYQAWLKKEFGELIDLLALPDLQKRFLRLRWLDQVLWTEGKAAKEQKRYYTLRVLAIVGGVLIPALVSLDIGGSPADVARWTAFALGLLVAAAVALDGFFRFGDRWRHYRRTAELLKIEGWQYFEQAGAYENQDHAAAFPLFAARTEAIMQQDVEGFVSVIATEKPDNRSDLGASPGMAAANGPPQKPVVTQGPVVTPGPAPAPTPVPPTPTPGPPTVKPSAGGG